MPGLATKMRPKTFNEYMGSNIRNTLVHRMEREETYPHTILLYGTRGCGKTTAARLLAKEYLCLDKQNGHACGKCEACQEIDEKLINTEAGESVLGVTELDIAADNSKGKIEDSLLEALEPPMYPFKYKILILDECHMATKQAQNRLLKITEEPPKHLILIFCTTDPDEMLPTLRDRCQLKIKVKKADRLEMRERMLDCCKQEGWSTSYQALDRIIQKCDRNPRKCWNDLENISTNFDSLVNIDNVAKYYDSVGDTEYFEYIKKAQLGLEEIVKEVSNIHEKGIEYSEFLSGLTQFIISCIEVRYGINLENYPESFVKNVNLLFKSYKSSELDMLLQIIEYANSQASKNISDEAMLHLIVQNTALRICKLGYLAKGLQNEQAEALKETEAGQHKASELIRKEEESTQVKQIDLDDGLLASVFGKNVTEVVAGEKEITQVNESTTDNKEVWTDDLLRSLMN